MFMWRPIVRRPPASTPPDLPERQFGVATQEPLLRAPEMPTIPSVRSLPAMPASVGGISLVHEHQATDGGIESPPSAADRKSPRTRRHWGAHGDATLFGDGERIGVEVDADDTTRRSDKLGDQSSLTHPAAPSQHTHPEPTPAAGEMRPLRVVGTPPARQAGDAPLPNGRARSQRQSGKSSCLPCCTDFPFAPTTRRRSAAKPERPGPMSFLLGLDKPIRYLSRPMRIDAGTIHLNYETSGTGTPLG